MTIPEHLMESAMLNQTFSDYYKMKVNQDMAAILYPDTEPKETLQLIWECAQYIKDSFFNYWPPECSGACSQCKYSLINPDDYNEWLCPVGITQKMLLARQASKTDFKKGLG